MLEVLSLPEFRAPAMLSYVEDKTAEIHQMENYLGPTLLPIRSVEDREWEYLKGGGEIPIMAEITDFGSPAPVGGRATRLEKVSGPLVTIKRKYPMDVDTLYAIQRAMRSGASAEYKAAIRTAFNDADRVIRNIVARHEYIRWQALTTGKVTYTDERGLVVNLDYGFPAVKNTFYASTNWSDTENATPLTDLMEACDAMEKEWGVRPTRAVARRTDWSRLLRNRAEAQLWVHGSDLQNRPLMQNELNTLLAEMDLPGFVVYETKVRHEDPQTKAVTEIELLPEGMILLLPPSNVPIGESLIGPTPTEVWNSDGYADGIIRMETRPELVVRIYKEGNDPGIVWTLGESTMAPTLPGIQNVAWFYTAPKGS